MTVRTVIKGGTVVDGTNAPRYRADVAVEDGTVVEIGPDLQGTSVLDASGCVVAPGFIDVHTHYDAQVFWDPALTPSSWHGVTSVVAGNCGFSIAPVRADMRGLLIRTLEHVEDMDPATLTVGVPWDEFETFPDYLNTLEARGTVLNVAAYVGHTAVRLWTMGEAAYEREATDQEIGQMRAVVSDALAAGAIGFSTSAGRTQHGDGGRPVPSRHANFDEIETLVSTLRDAGKGIAEFIVGDRYGTTELYDLQKRVGRPFTYGGIVTQPNGEHDRRLTENTEAWANGAEVWPQVSPRPVIFQMSMAAPYSFQGAKSFAELSDTPVETRAAAYADAAWRRQAASDIASLRSSPRWETISVADSAAHPDLVGQLVVELGESSGRTPLEVLLDIALDDQLTSRFNITLANDDRDAVRRMLQDDNCLLGLSDAGAHVSQICDACLPTDLLGNWVREREALTLESAVYKLTGQPAAVFGLGSRGVLRAGGPADIVVFDPDTVSPGPLTRRRDFPANGERVVAAEPQGVLHVLVNGTPIRIDGKALLDNASARPGVLIRS